MRRPPRTAPDERPRRRPRRRAPRVDRPAGVADPARGARRDDHRARRHLQRLARGADALRARSRRSSARPGPTSPAIGVARRGRSRRWSSRSLFAFVVVDLRGDAIVAGLAINLFALGATTFLMRAIFGVQGGYYDPTMPGLPDDPHPVRRGHPAARAARVGPHDPRVGRDRGGRRPPGPAVPPQGRAADRARWGRTRSPPAASGSASGASATARSSAAALLCGLAGAQLSLGLVTQFVEGMTAGRGFIALVAVMFGRAHPVGVLAASLFFGGAYALALRLQGAGHPATIRADAPVPRDDRRARRHLMPAARCGAAPTAPSTNRHPRWRPPRDGEHGPVTDEAPEGLGQDRRTGR